MKNNKFKEENMDSFMADDFSSNYSSDSIDPKSRKPVMGLGSNAKDLVKAGVPAGMKTAGKHILSSMPNTSELLSDIGAAKDIGVESLGELRAEVRKAAIVGKRATAFALPTAKRFIPKGMYNKLEEFSKSSSESTGAEAEDAYSEAQNVARASSEAMFANIASTNKTKDEHARADKLVDKARDSLRHRSTIGMLSNINSQLEFSNQYTVSAQQDWMKKMLELKYMHLYTSKETLGVLKVFAQSFEDNIAIVSKNTALPEVAKAQSAEFLKHSVRGKIADLGVNSISGMVGGAAKGFKSNVVDNIGQLAPMLDMLIDSMEVERDMEGDFDQLGMGKSKGEKAGGPLGTILGMIGGRSALNKIRPIANVADRTARTVQGKIKTGGRDFADALSESDNIALKLIGSMIPKKTTHVDVGNQLFEEGATASVFDNATRQSIVEVIPLWLSKIAKNTRDSVTGTDTEIEAYDPKKRKIVSMTQAKASVMESMLGAPEERGQAMVESLGAIKGIAAMTSTVKESTYKELEADLLIVINNAVVNGVTISARVIKEATAASKPEELTGRGIKLLMKGTKDPIGVIQLIKALYFNPDGTKNNENISFINDGIHNAHANDTLRTKLSSTLETFGSYNLFADDIDGGQFSTDALNKERLNIAESSLSDDPGSYLSGAAQQTKDLSMIYREDRENFTNSKFAQNIPSGIKTAAGKLAKKDVFLLSDLASYISGASGDVPISVDADGTIRIETPEYSNVAGSSSGDFYGPMPEMVGPMPQQTIKQMAMGTGKNTFDRAKHGVKQGVKKAKGLYSNTSSDPDFIGPMPSAGMSAKRKAIGIGNSAKDKALGAGKSVVDAVDTQLNKTPDELRADLTRSKKKVGSLIKELNKAAELDPDEDPSVINRVKKINSVIMKEISKVVSEEDQDKLMKTVDATNASVREKLTKYRTVSKDFYDKNISSHVTKARSGIETAQIKGMYAGDKIASGAETLAIKSMYGFDSLKKGAVSLKDQALGAIGTVQDKTIGSSRLLLEMKSFHKSFRVFAKTGSLEGYDDDDMIKDTKWEITKSLTRRAKDSIKSGGGKLGRTIGGVATTYGKGLKGAGKWLADKTGQAAPHIGSALGTGVGKLGDLAGILAKGGSDIAGSGLDMMGEFYKGGFGLAKSLVDKVPGLAVQPNFVDVYIKDEVKVGSPLVSAKVQKKNGLVAETKKRLKKTIEITSPIIHSETGDVLVSEEDIEKGLVTVSGKSIYDGAGGGIHIDLGGAFAGAGGLLSSGLNVLSGGVGVYGSILKGAGKAGLGAMGYAKDKLSDMGFGSGGIAAKVEELTAAVNENHSTMYELLNTRLGATTGEPTTTSPTIGSTGKAGAGVTASKTNPMDDEGSADDAEDDYEEDVHRKGSYLDQMRAKAEGRGIKVPANMTDAKGMLKGGMQNLANKPGLLGKIGSAGMGISAAIDTGNTLKGLNDARKLKKAAKLAKAGKNAKNLGKLGKFGKIGGALGRFGSKAAGLATMIPGAGAIGGGLATAGTALAGAGAAAGTAIAGAAAAAAPFLLPALAVAGVAVGGVILAKKLKKRRARKKAEKAQKMAAGAYADQQLDNWVDTLTEKNASKKFIKKFKSLFKAGKRDEAENMANKFMTAKADGKLNPEDVESKDKEEWEAGQKAEEEGIENEGAFAKFKKTKFGKVAGFMATGGLAGMAARGIAGKIKNSKLGKSKLGKFVLGGGLVGMAGRKIAGSKAGKAIGKFGKKMFDRSLPGLALKGIKKADKGLGKAIDDPKAALKKTGKFLATGGLVGMGARKLFGKKKSEHGDLSEGSINRLKTRELNKSKFAKRFGAGAGSKMTMGTDGFAKASGPADEESVKALFEELQNRKREGQGKYSSVRIGPGKLSGQISFAFMSAELHIRNERWDQAKAKLDKIKAGMDKVDSRADENDAIHAKYKELGGKYIPDPNGIDDDDTMVDTESPEWKEANDVVKNGGAKKEEADTLTGKVGGKGSKLKKAAMFAAKGGVIGAAIRNRGKIGKFIKGGGLIGMGARKLANSKLGKSKVGEFVKGGGLAGMAARGIKGKYTKWKNSDLGKLQREAVRETGKAIFNRAKKTKLGQKVIGGINAVKDKYGNIKDKITGGIDAVKDKYSDIKQGIKDKITGVRDKITGKYNDIKTGISDKVNAVKDKIGDTRDKIVGKISDTKDAIKAKAKSMWDNSLIMKGVRGVKNIHGKVTDKIADVKAGIKDKIAASKKAARDKFDKSFMGKMLNKGKAGLEKYRKSDLGNLQERAIRATAKAAGKTTAGKIAGATVPGIMAKGGIKVGKKLYGALSGERGLGDPSVTVADKSKKVKGKGKPLTRAGGSGKKTGEVGDDGKAKGPRKMGWGITDNDEEYEFPLYTDIELKPMIEALEKRVTAKKGMPGFDKLDGKIDKLYKSQQDDFYMANEFPKRWDDPFKAFEPTSDLYSQILKDVDNADRREAGGVTGPKRAGMIKQVPKGSKQQSLTEFKIANKGVSVRDYFNKNKGEPSSGILKSGKVSMRDLQGDKKAGVMKKLAGTIKDKKVEDVKSKKQNDTGPQQLESLEKIAGEMETMNNHMGKVSENTGKLEDVNISLGKGFNEMQQTTVEAASIAGNRPIKVEQAAPQRVPTIDLSKSRRR